MHFITFLFDRISVSHNHYIVNIIFICWFGKRMIFDHLFVIIISDKTDKWKQERKAKHKKIRSWINTNSPIYSITFWEICRPKKKVKNEKEKYRKSETLTWFENTSVFLSSICVHMIETIFLSFLLFFNVLSFCFVLLLLLAAVSVLFFRWHWCCQLSEDAFIVTIVICVDFICSYMAYYTIFGSDLSTCLNKYKIKEMKIE